MSNLNKGAKYWLVKNINKHRVSLTLLLFRTLGLCTDTTIEVTLYNWYLWSGRALFIVAISIVSRPTEVTAVQKYGDVIGTFNYFSFQKVKYQLFVFKVFKMSKFDFRISFFKVETPSFQKVKKSNWKPNIRISFLRFRSNLTVSQIILLCFVCHFLWSRMALHIYSL